MAQKQVFKKHVLPHLLAVVGFIAVALAYNHPLLQGKTIRQGDVTQFQGMVKGQLEYREATGGKALWAHRMFSGMPGFQISMPTPKSMAGWSLLRKPFHQWLPRPAGAMALYFVGFYVLMLAFGLEQGLAVAGALAFGLSSYNLIILEAGHMTKAFALGYAPMVLAGVVFTFRHQAYMLGAALTAIALGLELRANHVQISYYLGFIIIFFGLGELVLYLKRREGPAFVRRAVLLIAAAVIAVAANSTNLLVTAEYGEETIRGASELTSDAQNQTSGLDKDYILNDYSYGVVETFNLMIPNLMGGASTTDLGDDSEVYRTLTQRGVPPQNARRFVSRMPTYFGPQRFTSGPVYIGAVIVFLFVFGLIVVRTPLRWWLLAVTLLAIMLAWGKHFRAFSEFFIDYIPLYNKFRTVSMTLVIAQICMPLLGFMGLREVMLGRIHGEALKKALIRAGAISGGICALFIIMPGLLLNFTSESDAMLRQSLPDNIQEIVIRSLMEDRESLVRADALRSLAFILLTAALLYALALQKIKGRWAYGILAVLVIADLWTIDRRYLNEENYVAQTRLQQQNFPKTPADQRVLQDQDPHYRVLNLTVSPFNDATTSYYHRSIGGYHGAKLRRYQEIIERGISPEMRRLQQTRFDFSKTPVLNMLDCRYIIANRKAGGVVRNRKALGPAWLVKEIDIVPDADAEIAAVTKAGFRPAQKAILDDRFIDQVKDLRPAGPSQGQIALTTYTPDTVRYQYESQGEQFAVFSDVYYNDQKGWKAYIDGEAAPHARVNYVLRGMALPAGKHEITFIFEPQTYATGQTISLTGSLLLLVFLAGGVWHARQVGQQAAPDAAQVQ